VSGEATDLLTRLKRKWADESGFVGVNELEVAQAERLTERELRVHGRRLEGSQMALVRGLMERCAVYPLHFRMVADEFLGWKSWMGVNECVVKESIGLSIGHLLDGLENRFGKDLVRHVLGRIFLIH